MDPLSLGAALALGLAAGGGLAALYMLSPSTRIKTICDTWPLRVRKSDRKP